MCKCLKVRCYLDTVTLRCGSQFQTSYRNTCLTFRKRRAWQVEECRLNIFLLLSVTIFVVSWYWLRFFYVWVFLCFLQSCFVFLNIFWSLFFIDLVLFLSTPHEMVFPIKMIRLLVYSWAVCNNGIVEIFIEVIFAYSIICLDKIDGVDSMSLVEHWYFFHLFFF